MPRNIFFTVAHTTFSSTSMFRKASYSSLIQVHNILVQTLLPKKLQNLPRNSSAPNFVKYHGYDRQIFTWLHLNESFQN